MKIVKINSYVENFKTKESTFDFWVDSNSLVIEETDEYWEVVFSETEETPSEDDWSETIYKQKKEDHLSIDTPFFGNSSEYNFSMFIYVTEDNIEKGKEKLAVAIARNIQKKITQYKKLLEPIEKWLESTKGHYSNVCN